MSRRRRSRIGLAVLAAGVAASAALNAVGADPLAIEQDAVTRIEQTINTPAAAAHPTTGTENHWGQRQ